MQLKPNPVNSYWKLTISRFTENFDILRYCLSVDRKFFFFGKKMFFFYFFYNFGVPMQPCRGDTYCSSVLHTERGVGKPCDKHLCCRFTFSPRRILLFVFFFYTQSIIILLYIFFLLHHLNVFGRPCGNRCVCVWQYDDINQGSPLYVVLQLRVVVPRTHQNNMRRNWWFNSENVFECKKKKNSFSTQKNIYIHLIQQKKKNTHWRTIFNGIALFDRLGFCNRYDRRKKNK